MDSTTISKAKPAHKSMDYHFLREEGIRHIQKLAGSLWTDYNSHDPGITLLEVLCYAITDLGYRTNLPVEDLLAQGQDQENYRDFYGITEILPCSPVTLTDLRKIIIDHEDIRNAWLEKNTTTYDGLYDIMLELEDDDTWGNLNFNLLSAAVTFNATDYDVEVAFPSWDELPGFEEPYTITSLNMAKAEDGSDILVPIQQEDSNAASANDYYAELLLELNNDTENPFRLTTWIKITSEADETLRNSPTFQAALKEKLRQSGTDDLVPVYLQKIRAAHTKVSEVRQRLHSHRPLCEDFRSFQAFRIQEISLQADADLTPDARPEEVLAQIYYRIHAFLSPRPGFHTLESLLEKGRPIEDIFEGPLLRHGFIDTQELETIRQQEAIYTSDLLQLLTDIPGLVAIRDLRISNHYNNDILTQDVAHCLRLASPDRYKPQLSPEKSRISCYKNQLPVAADRYDTLYYFDALKTQARQAKKTAVYTLDPPKGKDREVAQYFSIQHHFPPAYGLGVAALPLSAAPARKAQARQLKGYLLFFEQLLADYFAQLSHIKTLFSIDAPISETYRSQAIIGQIPEAAALLDETAYTEQLADMAEPPGTDELPGVFYDRRNRLLDHLIARFCESFNDYALLRYAGNETAKNIAQRLINDKTAFLQEYPALSRDRAKAFDYLAQKPDESQGGILVPDLWDTDNVSGLKKRITRLLGLESYQRGATGSFHLIEHLLLRPGLGNNPAALQIPAGNGEFLADPYTFRISFILPAEHPELSRPDFRQYTENLIQSETPAHIVPHLYWVDNTQLSEFETACKAWLTQAFAPGPRNALVNILNTFNATQNIL